MFYYLAGVAELMIYAYFGVQEVATYSCNVIIAYAGGLVLRWWARRTEEIYTCISKFRAQDCTCFCEDDRPLVYGNIMKLMEDIGEVTEGAPEEEGLEAFNSMVRRDLPQSLTASGTLSYMQVAAVMLCTFFTTNVEMRLGEPYWKVEEDHHSRETQVRLHICFTIFSCIWALAGFPLGFAFISWWSGFCLHLNGWKEWAHVMLGIILVATMSISVDTFLLIPLARAGMYGSNKCVVLLVVILVSSTSCAVATFNRRKLPPKQHEREGKETAKEMAM